MSLVEGEKEGENNYFKNWGNPFSIFGIRSNW